MSNPVISTDRLCHSYGYIRALDDVSVEIFDHDYLAIVGQNGSGKSTLVKHFNGLLKPTSGRVFVEARDTRSADTRDLSRIVGYVFQNPDHMLFSTTVESEVALGPRNLALTGSEVKERVDRALDVTGLQGYRLESPFFLGKGLRRMVTLAAIIAMEPKVIVIDEPTTGMDYRGYVEVMAIVDRFHRDGKTIIIITHDMKLVSEHAKRVIAMSEGRKVLDMDTRAAFQEVGLLETCHLKPRPATQLADRLSGAGVSRGILTPEELVGAIRGLSDSVR